MNINVPNFTEVKKLIKEQSDKDRKYFEDMIFKLSVRIDDLEQMLKAQSKHLLNMES